MNKRSILVVVLLAAGLLSCAAFSSSDFPYCDVPLGLPENDATSEMTLSQLQVVIRHGDRTPTGKIPVDTVRWECEPFAHTHRFLNVSPQAVNQVPAAPFSFPPSCAKAQLTARGERQLLELGAAMRTKYIDRLRFLPPALTSANKAEFFFRSTDNSRTRQSGQAFLVGLYPAPNRIGNPILPLYIRDIENMIANRATCPRLKTIFDVDYPKSKLFDEIFQEYRHAAQKVGSKMGTWDNLGDSESQGKQVAAFYETLAASDNLFSRVCHDKRLPRGIGMKDVTAMRDATNAIAGGSVTFDQPASTEAARLSIGSFLSDISAKMVKARHRKPAPRMALYAGHDQTLWYLLATLSQNEDVMVPYASHLAFELWQDRGGDPWVAVEFNGEYLTVGDCPSALCRLPDFRNAIEKYVVTDYEKECRETAL